MEPLKSIHGPQVENRWLTETNWKSCQIHQISDDDFENPNLFRTGDKDSDDSSDGCECLHCRKLFTTSGDKMYHPNKYPQWCHEDCSEIDDFRKFICSFQLDDCKFLRNSCNFTLSISSVKYHFVLAIDQLKAQILVCNKFIIFLYMFRALLCSSSGGKIVLSQPAHRTATYRVWRYQMLYNTIWPPDDEHNSARNMKRNIIKLL